MEDFDLKKLNEIDKKTRKLISGYNRQIQNKLNDNKYCLFKHIPNVINYLCTFYYFEFEHFDIIGEGISLSDDKTTITKIAETGVYDNTTFSSSIISSMNSNIECKWSLKIVKSKERLITIGIAPYKKDMMNTSLWNSKSLHYLYNGWIGYKSYIDDKGKSKSTKYGSEFGEGDIVDIYINLKSKIITFYVNGKSQGVAFTKIESESDLKYRLFVSMHDRNDSVSLIKFEKKYL